MSEARRAQARENAATSGRARAARALRDGSLAIQRELKWTKRGLVETLAGLP